MALGRVVAIKREAIVQRKFSFSQRTSCGRTPVKEFKLYETNAITRLSFTWWLHRCEVK